MKRAFAYDFEGKRYDVGEKIGFVTTTIDFALKDAELRDKVLDYLKTIPELKLEKN